MKGEFDGYIEHEEMEFKGFGVILLTKKNQLRELTMINDPMMEEEIDAYKARFAEDRKSTRLNSSHVAISYAVFCLKKKRNNKIKNWKRLSKKLVYNRRSSIK